MKTLTDAETESCIRDLEVQGYAVVRGMLSPEEVEAFKTLTGSVRQALKGAFYPGYSDIRPEDEQVFNLQNKDRRYLDLLTHRPVERLLMARLNDPYYTAIPLDRPNYILGEYVCRSSGTPLRLHIDSWIPNAGPQCWMMQVVFALDDRPAEDGCTVVVPGSHQSGAYTDRTYENVTELPAAAGDMLMWDSRLWHGARPRASGRDSVVLIATVQMWWVKQRFDLPASVPLEIAESLSEREKALLGFCSQPPRDEFVATNMRRGYEVL